MSNQTRNAIKDAALFVARIVVQIAPRDATRNATWVAAGNATRDAAEVATQDATWNAIKRELADVR